MGYSLGLALVGSDVSIRTNKLKSTCLSAVEFAVMANAIKSTRILSELCELLSNIDSP